MEKDISERIRKIIKFTIPAIALLAIIGVVLIWIFQNNTRYITVPNAKVNGKMVQARSRVDGEIIEIIARNGEKVKVNQPILKLKVKVSEEHIKQLEQKVAVAKQNLEKLQEGTVVQRPVYNNEAALVSEERVARMQELYKIGAISAAELNEATAAGAGGSGSISYETVVQQSSPEVIQNGEFRLKQAEAALEDAKKSLAATEIAAPVEGFVFLEELKPGDTVKPGQLVASLGSNEGFWIEAELTENRKEKVFLGQSAKYTIDGKVFRGSVLEIGRKKGNVDIDDNAEMIYISLPAKSEINLYPGQTVDLKLSLP